ncbi:MAG: hypothetical protein M3280_03095 [Actinomycetota bacterium]|nr:hypothetical protein [Actinomycetota bacterium]
MPRRLLILVIGSFLLVATGDFVGAGPGTDASKNIDRLAQVPIEIGKNERAAGSDLAFQGDLLVAGAFEGIGLYRMLDRAPYLKQLSFYPCPASQNDVSIWGDLMFASIDSTGSNSANNAVCNNTDKSREKEGVRIVDISNPRHPRQVRFVETDCGSHTHVILPGGKKTIYIYVGSYPLSGQGPTCNAVSHRKVSVIKVPLDSPKKARVVATPSVTTTIGCHDFAFLPKKSLAAVACISEGQIWDVSNPVKPKILSRIYQPEINIWHSGGFTWDGRYAVFGDEQAGSTWGACPGHESSTTGALWFYDVGDPRDPKLKSHWALPRPAPAPDSPDEASYFRCTAHNYNVLPMRDPKRYVVASSFRGGGTSIVDFSKPGNPKELAHFMDLEPVPDTWSTYWYNGRLYANDNDSKTGIGVFKVDGLDKRKVRYFKTRLNPQLHDL